MVLNIKKIIFTLFVLTTVFSTLTSYGEDDKYIKSMGYGGKGGNHFEWKSEYPDYKLKEIYYTAGGSLDSYQMVYYYKDKLMKSPIFGNPSHQQQSWKVPDGEYVIKIIIYSGNLIDSIQFKTNKGTYSPKFGGNGGI